MQTITLEEQKRAVAEQKAVVETAETALGTLKEKRGEIAGRLAEIASLLTVARSDQEDAISRYSRGEASEANLDEANLRLSQLEAREKSIAAALKVVEAGIVEAEQTQDKSRQLLRRLTKNLWVAIGTAELAKASPTLRRAFVALGKGGLRGFSGTPEQDFLMDHVYNAVFVSIGESEAASMEALTENYKL